MKSSLTPIAVALAVGAASIVGAFAGSCSTEKIYQLTREGHSIAEIQAMCPDCPTWDNDGQMLFNPQCRYIGTSYPGCRQKRIGEEFNTCQEAEDVRRAQAAQRAAEIDARRAAEEEIRSRPRRNCEDRGMVWTGSRCITEEQKKHDDYCDRIYTECKRKGGRHEWVSTDAAVNGCGGYCNYRDHGKSP